MPPIHPGILIELIYSLIIIASSLIIYFSTKEIYELSNHKGIKYFRIAFLFFALAYIFRFSIKFIIATFNLPRILHIHPPVFGLFALFVFMYASTMAMFYLLNSVIWKRSNKYLTLPTFHITAMVVALISIFTQNVIILLFVQAAVFLFIAVESYLNYKKSDKKSISRLYTVYGLLFVFWILNILDVLVPNFLRFLQLTIYAASVVVMILILYKVLKKTGVIT
jgi:hypothetical protein